MASTSSAASSSHNYDVFLSFRGKDTRFSFTNNLYHALIHAGIRTFRDDDEIGGGQELKPELERSIIESKASIIVFSENFANSRWCLDELCLILQQRRNAGHFILPVFYKVDPSVVRKQQGSFMITAKEDLKWAENNVKRWKEALTEVADLKGVVVSGSRYEKDFIEDIVDQVRQKLGLDIRSPPASLTGIETRAERVISWLRSDQPDHPVLAICGMGGSGKTTLAKHIYYANKQNFEGCCLVEGIEQPDGLLGVQIKLLRDISGSNSMMISNVDEGAVQLERVIRMKKVLIVVDDIDDKDKLSSLFGTNAFHTRSKIIITTRILNIDTWFESVSFRCHVYQLELLNHGESLELLCWHAFGSKVPMDGFEKIAVELAQYCGGNPLALKVLGSSLFVNNENPSSVNNMKEIWKSRMNALNSLKGDFEHKIRGVLQRSFESLPCHSHKELFLHIGCFFVGDFKYFVEKAFDEVYQASYGVMTLINRCLVTVRDNRLYMHQLLQDMAINIVHEESEDLAKRSRIWHHDEAYALLSKGDGFDIIKGLKLVMPEGNQEMTSKTLKTSSLVKMKNLNFLHLRRVKLTGSFKNFPDLRWLWWDKSNIKTIPPGLLMSSLVIIRLTSGDLEKFDPPKVLYSLKILDLSWSYKLVSICNLHRLPKLESLYLSNCTSLTHVCETIGDLENLSILLLEGCTKLWKDSSNQKFVNQLERMKALFICGGIPEQPLFSLPQSLFYLDLSNNLFMILPNHIDLKVLQTLHLHFCSNLKSLPCLPSTLKKLYVNWCTSLERITFQTARFTLQQFTYEGCYKLCEIEGLFKLVSVSKLEEADLEPMQWIKAYQNHKVDLIGDVITKDRTFDIQMLYEYGIRSIYLQGIEDQSMMNYEYMSSSNMLSFCVPMLPKKNRIQGLNVAVLYISSGGDDRDTLRSFTKISNRTKGLSWVYNPVVFCKPGVKTDVVWLSHWPIGNILDADDKVNVTFYIDKKFTVIECGASLVYMDDEHEVVKEEKSEQMKTGEEVIGGDLSSFQVGEGAYYLCRRDLYKSRTPNELKWLFGDNIESTSTTDTEGWRMSRRSGAAIVNPGLISFQNTSRWKIKAEFLVINFDSESETKMIEKAVSSVEGVESVIIHNETGRLTVCGCFNPQAVIKCVIQIEKMVVINDINPY